MAVSPEQMRAHLARRVLTGRERARERQERLGALVPEASRLLRERYSAQKVLLFGSLASKTATDQSDVDLAVLGLAPERYFAALSDLMALFGGAVDLVRLEEARGSLRDRILAEGIEP